MFVLQNLINVYGKEGKSMTNKSAKMKNLHKIKWYGKIQKVFILLRKKEAYEKRLRRSKKTFNGK